MIIIPGCISANDFTSAPEGPSQEVTIEVPHGADWIIGRLNLSAAASPRDETSFVAVDVITSGLTAPTLALLEAQGGRPLAAFGVFSGDHWTFGKESEGRIFWETLLIVSWTGGAVPGKFRVSLDGGAAAWSEIANGSDRVRTLYAQGLAGGDVAEGIEVSDGRREAQEGVYGPGSLRLQLLHESPSTSLHVIEMQSGTKSSRFATWNFSSWADDSLVVRAQDEQGVSNGALVQGTAIATCRVCRAEWIIADQAPVAQPTELIQALSIPWDAVANGYVLQHRVDS